MRDNHLTLEALDVLKSGAEVILHTDRCGCAAWLKEQRIPYSTFDSLYEQCSDFDEHTETAAAAIVEKGQSADVVYGVFDVRDRSACLVAERMGESVRVIPGPPLEGALMPYAHGEMISIEASDWESVHLNARQNCLIRELDNRALASEIKLKLMEVYPEEQGIRVVDGDGQMLSIPLYELDRLPVYDHTTCALIPACRKIKDLERYDFEHLNELMRLLCAPDGCPWDRVQTHQSLRTCLLEETYEVLDAVEAGDLEQLCDELGDLLMQVAIHAEIARRHGEFEMSDITTSICKKLIARHTHIFGADKAETPEQVLALWDQNKMKERGQQTLAETLRSVAKTMPALLRAVKVVKRSATAGLTKNRSMIIESIAHKLGEISNPTDPEACIGSLLLDVAALAQKLEVDPEIALNKAIDSYVGNIESREKDGGSTEWP